MGSTKTASAYLDPINSALTAVKKISVAGYAYRRVTLPNEAVPNVSFHGGEIVDIWVSETALELFQARRARLRITLPVGDSQPKIFIGRFSGEINLNFQSGDAAFVLEDCKNFNMHATFYEASYIQIGRQCSANSCNATVSGAAIIMGRDCMLSHNVTLQPSDQHDIFDVKTGLLLNTKRSITVGKHVWLGKGAYVGAGVNIADGAIVAANASVASDVPENAIVAGNPAKVVRENVAWERTFTPRP